MKNKLSDNISIYNTNSNIIMEATTITTTVKGQPNVGGQLCVTFNFAGQSDALVVNGPIIGELQSIEVACKVYTRTGNMDIFGTTLKHVLIENPKLIHVEFNDHELQMTYYGIMFRYMRKE